jgi:hypothetical protein
MEIDPLTFVRIFEGLALIVGLTITYFALRAHRRSKQPSMLILAVSFLFLTIAGLSEGVLFEVLKYDILFAQAVRSAIALAGLSGILYAILNIK